MSESEILQRQIEVYRQSFLEHGDSPRATFNTDRRFQELRFERLIAPLLPLEPGVTLHDVGAGLCDLHGWLLERRIEHRYSGTEIVPEMVEAARRKYPGVRLERRDLLGPAPADRHELVVASGLFNIPGRVERGAWAEFVLAMIARMYEMATHAMAFNFLTSYRTFSDPALHYADPGRLFDFCQRELSRFVHLDHAYPFYEGTIAVFRPEFVRSRFDDPPFAKYFRTAGR
jgi:hypothetical protein